MITWMQRHNRWLVWTIWVATIAFIGAGFVGWGSYKYGSKASAVGQVGDIEISRERLNFTYSNLYSRYNEIFQGKFDEEQAKKMGLLKQAFDSLASQAQLLNLAKEFGITVSEKELAEYIASMQAFKENGVFSKKVYKTYLQNRRIKSSTFEDILKDELTIQKLMGLIEFDAMPFERDVVSAALGIEDKIAYKVLSPDDFQIKIDESTLKKEWEASKNDYLSPRSYKLSVFWTDTSDINVSDADIRDYYDKNSFNYVDAQGKQISFEDAKSQVAQDLKIKKGKKQALLDYIAVKKGKMDNGDTLVLPLNDNKLSQDIWKEISQSDAGALLKPKPVGSRYATVRVEEVIEPKPLPFEEAKKSVEAKLKLGKSVDMMEQKAKELLDNIDKSDLTESAYLSLAKAGEIPPLDKKESLQFLQKLFTISGKKGIIRLSKRLVVYKIVDQRMAEADQNLSVAVQNEANKIKKGVFESALFEKLNEKFPVKVYIKGL